MGALQRALFTAWLIWTALDLVVCSIDYHEEATEQPTTAHVNRGAARQMYGSGSLRQPGHLPTHIPDDHHSMHPEYTERKDERHRIPVHPIPMPNGLFVPNSRIGSSLSWPPGRNSHVYRERPQQISYTGHMDPVIHHGRVWIPIPQPRQPYGRRIGGHRAGYSNFKHQPHDMDEPSNYDDSPCTDDCNADEYLCARMCQCIALNSRCDGQIDCATGEDELDCSENENLGNTTCEEIENHVRCPGSGKCISKDWLCDGDDDCGDFSDETHCGMVKNCTSDQFTCNNGLCIPSSWHCDNDNDCKDFSDETSCLKSGCTQNEFQCSDGTCIALLWKCDKTPDCPDGFDETDCEFEIPTCSKDEFQCSYQKCIRKEFRCDGDDDCGDWSDEDDCPKTGGSCVSGEFKCNNGRCIPNIWKCDRERDCDEGEDETNCGSVEQPTCSAEEFTCTTGSCILRTWVCDGYMDCSMGVDEHNCEVTCDESKFSCAATINPNDTSNFCINKKHVCDGQKNCPRGEDEMNCPKKRDCEKETNCSQLCVTLADGRNACSCHSGYILAKDGINCIDINECLFETDPVCSQKCTNTVGSFICGCMTGYVLRPDLRTCKAVGAPPTLLFANRIDIRQVSLSNSKYSPLLKGLHNAIALDYHYEKGLIYWTDVSIDVIRRATINGTNATDVIKWGLESPGGVALDWVHDLLFWTDSGTRRIEAATLDGKNRAVVATDDLDKPRAIVVHPGEALLFWTDWGPNPKIERSEMDGSNRKSIITETVFWPNGLALDYTTNRLYWADAKHNVIESALFDGSDRKKVISKGLPHPFALTLFEDAIYWTDWHTKSISTANKITGAGLRIIHSDLHFPMDIHSFHPQRQPWFRDHCMPAKGGCSHLCLPNNKSYTCVCPFGEKLQNDGRSCKMPQKLLIYARRKDIRARQLEKKNISATEMVIPLENIKSAVSISWDSKTESIFWSDVEKYAINVAHWNGSNQRTLISSNLISPTGIAYDWITDKLYWIDSGTLLIEVSNADGTMRSVLKWEDMEKPRDITLSPQDGLLFWSDWGSSPKIEKLEMDGSNSKVIVQKNMTFPYGLAADSNLKRLYWTDSGSKTIEYSSFDGTGRKILLSKDLHQPFGLDVYGSNIYWTDLNRSSIETANKMNGNDRLIIASNISSLMTVGVFHNDRKNVKNPCSKRNGGCSHLCLLNSVGKSCACPTGISLKSDLASCPEGPFSSLIFTHRVDIRRVSLDVPYLVDVVLPLPPLKNAIAVDVDRLTGEIYWTDTAEDIIQKATPDGKKISVIIENELETADGLAIDSVGRKLYWTDNGRNSIEVAELNGTQRKVLIWEDLDNPRAITLYYPFGLMFWSDYGSKPKIEKAYMDGTSRKVLISDKVQWPNGLAIDSVGLRIYWTDGKLKTIESSDFSGKERRIIISNVKHPYGIVVDGNYIYWTDWQTKALHRAEKRKGNDKKVIRDKLEGLMDIRAVHNYTNDENVCGTNNGGCSHLCLRSSKLFTCACPTGVLFRNGSEKICETQPFKYLLFATHTSLSRISLDTDVMWDVTIPIEGIDKAIAVDFHWENGRIFFTDVHQRVIRSVNMHHVSESKMVVSENLTSPNGLAIDWIANNIYWTDTAARVLEVARVDGSSRKVLVKTAMHEPRAVAVYPKKGYLFWADWGEAPKIERSFMDGTERKPIVDNDLGYPNGLAIDYEARRLYWADALKDRIETSDLQGRNRVRLVTDLTHPFGLTQFGQHIYWTDWFTKSVVQAEKTTGKKKINIRTDLEGIMEMKAVAAEKQTGWNPCAENNGGCTHLCLFRKTNYTCACPDMEGDTKCKKEPTVYVPLRPDEDDDDINYNEADSSDAGEVLSTMERAKTLLITLTVILTIALVLVMSIGGFVAYQFMKKKEASFTGTRCVMTFSNPNYFSAGQEINTNGNVADKKPFLWKRLKYDKCQERVYEDKASANSPEVASLIPTVLTPCSSNCEAVTPELERSPSPVVLRKTDRISSATMQPIV